MTGNKINTLEPKFVWGFFSEISKIYRASGNNKEISNYLKQNLENEGFDVNQVQEGEGKYNIIATRNVDKEKKNAIILQAHMDMVAVSDNNDPKKPIKLDIEDDWVFADKRTLGADNGIGLAAALAVAKEDKFKDKPLEIIFTVDEETTTIGAVSLKEEDFYGKYMISLDNENINTIEIGCAGIIVFNEKFKCPIEKLDTGFSGIEIKVSGAKGGHSGVDIEKDHINPIKEVIKVLLELPVKIQKLQGGNAFNSIPTDFNVNLAVKTEQVSQVIASLSKKLNFLKDKNSNIFIEILETSILSSKTLVLEKTFQQEIFDFINKMPVGVLKKYPNGNLLSSRNLAIINFDDENFHLAVSMRSSEKSDLENMRSDTSEQLSKLLSKKVETKLHNMPWQPDNNSPLAHIALEQCKEKGVKSPSLEVSHGFLETSIFAEKVPDMDIIAIGPTIKKPHSIEEALQISTTKTFYSILKNIIEKLYN